MKCTLQIHVGDWLDLEHFNLQADNYEKKRKSRLLELYKEEVNYQKEEERRRLKEIKKIEALLNKKKAEFLKVKPKK